MTSGDIRSLTFNKNWTVPPKPSIWKSYEGTQKAHEVIRQTHSDHIMPKFIL
jgi:hypothetical protein